jgi:hypothetical protein
MPSSGPTTGEAPNAIGEYDPDLPDSPMDRPGFEVRAVDEDIKIVTESRRGAEFYSQPVFVPDYYPDTMRQNKDKELNRDGRQCSGEKITVDKIKNREFHVQGIMLEYEVGNFNELCDYAGDVELVCPMVPRGAMKCIIKSSEVGENQGYDPHAGQWMFEYTLDLVSTGEDEYDESGRNAIVSKVLGDAVPVDVPGGAGASALDP